MDYIGLISQLGFPVAVAAYLLFKLEAKLNAAERAAILLAEKMEKHMTCCHKCQDNQSSSRTAEEAAEKKQN